MWNDELTTDRYDIVCPAITSYELYKALGGAENGKLTYTILPDCGHSAHEIPIEEELVKTADAFGKLLAAK